MPITLRVFATDFFSKAAFYLVSIKTLVLAFRPQNQCPVYLFVKRSLYGRNRRRARINQISGNSHSISISACR